MYTHCTAKMNYLQLEFFSYTSMPYGPNDYPSGSQLVVASPSDNLSLAQY